VIRQRPLFGGKRQLGFIGQTQPLSFQRMNRVAPTFAEHNRQSHLDIFVEEEPQFHFAQAKLTQPMGAASLC
jgi:hypothetical protein